MNSNFNAPPPSILAGEIKEAADHHIASDVYWRKLLPQLSKFGITRIADITGLDIVGLPVAQAVRPAARSNVVTQGKGTTLQAAAIGAVLECLEMAAGEDLCRFDTQIGQDYSIWRPLAVGQNWPTDATDFLPAWNLSKECPATIPAALVSTDFSVGAAAEDAPILRSSVGLGAGANFSAAVCHGILELIESDARLRAERHGNTRRICLCTDDPTYGPILERANKAGLRVCAEDISRLGLSIVKISVMEEPAACALPLPAVGYAARFEPSKAIASSLTEALQARLAVISGAREDITQRLYRHDFSAQELADEWQRHGPPKFAPNLEPQIPTPKIQDLLRVAAPVFAVPLHWDKEVPLAVVRVVAPNLVTDPLRLEGQA